MQFDPHVLDQRQVLDGQFAEHTAMVRSLFVEVKVGGRGLLRSILSQIFNAQGLLFRQIQHLPACRTLEEHALSEFDEVR